MLDWLFRSASDRTESAAASVDEAPAAAVPAGSSVAAPDVGAVLSERYRLDGLLGRGGAASVYRGWDLLLEQAVAVKVLRPDAASLSTSGFNDLRREAVAAMQLSHPLIARVFNYERHDGLEFLVMELVPGKNLHDLRRERAERRLSVDETVRIARDMLEALAYAHDAGVVHNDIKPRNVLMDPRGALKVCDFGLAELVSRKDRPSDRITGTPGYLSPERILTKPSDGRSDLYSLGATLYELAAGRPPFGKAPDEALRGHLLEPVPASPHLPLALDRVLRRAMAKNPDERFQSARQMAEALDALDRGRALARAAGPASPSRVEAEPVAQSEERPEVTAAEPERAQAPEAQAPEAPPGMAEVDVGKVRFDEREYEVAPFHLDRLPVTNDDYAAYVKATGAMAPAWWPGSRPPKDKGRHPVVGVTLEDAERYAAWRGKRLPTTLEWAAAARGAEGRRYPWGETCDQSACNCPLKANDTAPVDAHPGSGTPEGVLDLFGNVWEWTDVDERVAPAEEGYRYVLGASYQHRCSAPNGALPRTLVSRHGEYRYLGFRCAWDRRMGR